MENTPGTIGWHNLTVDNASDVKSFYEQVLGWKSQALSMGDYDDYVMMLDAETPAGGVCHARDANADLPPQWLMYVNVADLDASLDACRRMGGKLIGEKRKMGNDGRHYCLIQDPAGAHMMICG
jgi:predicted enzyme related to lactoylglutathione lyase